MKYDPNSISTIVLPGIKLGIYCYLLFEYLMIGYFIRLKVIGK